MIKRLFYVEFYKATHNNKYFWWTIIVGSALAFVEAIQTLFEVSPIVKNLLCLPEIYHSFNGISLFYLWNGVVTLHGASAVENAIRMARNKLCDKIKAELSNLMEETDTLDQPPK